MIIEELFNVRSGAHITQSESKEHPGAEYFTAERAVTEEERAADIKRVSIVFRKLVTVKDGKVVDCVKSGERPRLVAGTHNGKTVLFEGGQESFSDEIIGVCVRVVLHYDK